MQIVVYIHGRKWYNTTNDTEREMIKIERLIYLRDEYVLRRDEAWKVAEHMNDEDGIIGDVYDTVIDELNELLGDAQ